MNLDSLDYIKRDIFFCNHISMNVMINIICIKHNFFTNYLFSKTKKRALLFFCDTRFLPYFLPYQISFIFMFPNNYFYRIWSSYIFFKALYLNYKTLEPFFNMHIIITKSYNFLNQMAHFFNLLWLIFGNMY